MFIWAAWQFDSVQLHSGPMYHKEVTWSVMRCVEGEEGKENVEQGESEDWRSGG